MNTINALGKFPVIGQVELAGGAVPLLDIKMMSPEREQELELSRAVEHYIEVNGCEPESARAAYEWRKKWVREVLAGIGIEYPSMKRMNT